MGFDDSDPLESLSDPEIEALHLIELSTEHLHRAHGHLIAFHHNTGRAMNHLAAAEERLRTADYEVFADAIRNEHLPRGVIESRRPDDHGRWSYDVLETYEEVFLDDIVTFGQEVCDTIADGLRHVHERKQEIEWKRRSKRD